MNHPFIESPRRIRKLPLVVMTLAAAGLLAFWLMPERAARFLGADATPAPAVLLDPVPAIQQGAVARRERIRALMARAEQLAPERWQASLAGEALRSPIQLNHGEDGRFLVDDRLKAHFVYFTTLLAARIGQEEAISRLLATLAALPEPERLRMRALLEGHLVVEDALDGHARLLAAGRHGRDREAAQARLRAAMQTDDAHARLLARHAVDQLAAQVHRERVEIIQTQGGPGVARLHERAIQRATRESALALNFSDPDIDLRERLRRALQILDVQPQQSMNEPTNTVRQAYVRIDQRLIEPDAQLSGLEKRRLRLAFFGSGYLAERDRLGSVQR